MKVGRLKGFALLLALATLLSACAMMALGLEKPEVKVAGIELLDGNLFDQRFRIKLRVTNPNDKDIAIKGLRFKLALGGQDFADGLTGEPVVLPRMGEVVVGVDGHASLAGVLRHLPRMLEGGKLDYRLNGEVITQDYGSLPFDRKGELSADSLGKRFLPPPPPAGGEA